MTEGLRNCGSCRNLQRGRDGGLCQSCGKGYSKWEPHESDLYTRTVRRLERTGRTYYVEQIIYLAEEIEGYREKIRYLERELTMCQTKVGAQQEPEAIADLKSMLHIKDATRPCWCRGKKAIFHRWVNNAHPVLPRGEQPSENARYFQYRSTGALVEFEDGTLARAWPNEIQFADGGEFRDMEWLPLEETEV